MPPRKPTRDELEAAAGKTVPDVIGPGLSVLFCGINPGLYSAATGHHFGRPGNRFWKALHAAGFTERNLDPSEGRTLLRRGYGITNLVSRATARAEELTAAELVRGRRSLERKVRRYAPRSVAVLGIGSFRSAFEQPKAKLGLQPESLAGAMLWLLPNPSGLNAHHQPVALAGKLRELREAVESESEGITIARLATEAEAEACARLMATSEPWVTLGRGYQASLRIVKDPTRETFVIRDRGGLAGFLILCLTGAFVGYIQTICIDPGRRGRGLGSKLVEFAEQRILQVSPNVFMCVSSFNPDARRLYQRLGYRVVGELTDYIVQGHSEVLLRKTFGPLTGYRPDAPSEPAAG